MNRGIKFRAWDKSSKKWAYIDIDDWKNSTMSACLIEPQKDKFMVFELRNDDRYEWQEFTGLKDKNGKEIYEGDIVKRYCPCGYCANSWRGIIFWRESNAGFVFRDYKNEEDSPVEMFQEHGGEMAILKILGNIYENPDLLK